MPPTAERGALLRVFRVFNPPIATGEAMLRAPAGMAKFAALVVAVADVV